MAGSYSQHSFSASLELVSSTFLTGVGWTAACPCAGTKTPESRRKRVTVPRRQRHLENARATSAKPRQ
jgi:hypothetical protein